jgi:hypothetical protein
MKTAVFFVNNVINTDNGVIYKNEEIFENSHDEICYIPEYGLEDLEELIKEGKNLNEIEIIEKGIGFSRNSLIRDIIIFYDETCTEEQIQESKLKYNNKVIDVKKTGLDKSVFEYLDWSYPTTLMSDIDFMNDLEII